MALMHATVVAIDDKGVLITGPSGSGKSDLALRLIDRGAVLVSDDQVELNPHKDGKGLSAASPKAIAGVIELRGVGLVKTTYMPVGSIALHVDLEEGQNAARLPDPQFTEFLGVKIKKIWLNAFEQSAPLKIEWALKGDFFGVD